MVLTTDPLYVEGDCHSVHPNGRTHCRRKDGHEPPHATARMDVQWETEPPRAVRQRRILAAISTGAVLYGAHVTVWAIPMLLGAVAGALLFLVWQPQDRLERLRKAW